jgi:hypothetical protein
MIRPNAILINVKDVNNKRWNVVYIQEGAEIYSNVGEEYIKTKDPTNLDPFVNWLDYIPNTEWVHPVYAKRDSNGWKLKAFDTFNKCEYYGESISLDKLFERGVLFKTFDKLLNNYKCLNDDELLEVLNSGRINNKWTIQALNEFYEE